MIPEKLFEKLLVLGDAWRVKSVEYVEQQSKVVIRVEETPQLWASQKCPHCEAASVAGYDHAPERSWRHLNVCQLESEITCALPRGQCRKCRQVFTVRAPWEGRSRGLSQEFEAFALILMREMPVKKAGEILGETDHKLWRMLFAHVDAAWSVNIMRKSEMPLEQERPGLDFSRGASGLAGEDRAHAARGKRAESKN